MKVNMHTSHPSAFISSTFTDLHEEREYVAEVLAERGLNVNALDIKPASNDSSRKEILGGIKESDFVILLIGDRYGSILPQMTGSEYLSITNWEYQRAIALGKPVLAYFKNNIDADTQNHDDPSELSYKKKRRLFERFKKMIQTRHSPAYFTDSFELGDKVQKSLISVYRSGVKILNSKNLELSNKVAELERETERLKNELKSKEPDKLSPLQNSLLGSLGKPMSDALPKNILVELLKKKK